MKRCPYRKAVLKNLVKITRKHSEEVVQRCSVKKDVLRNFAKFTGKHLRQSLSFDTGKGVFL